MVHESEATRVKDRNGRWKGLARIDPLAEVSWGFVWGHNELDAALQPPGDVIGLAAAREGKQMLRPESQRAFGLWKNTFTPEDVARGHDGMREAYDRMLLTNFPIAEGSKQEKVELGSVPAIRVAGDATPDGHLVVLHFHGGAYVLGSAASSVEYAHRLAKAVNGSCYTVDYRLAPEHPYPAAIDDAVAAYRGLLNSGIPANRILLSGESSGGGLALALAMSVRGAGMPAPIGIFAACPFVDLTLGGESVKLHSGEDPAAHRDTLSLLAASYFQAHEPTDPLVSPLFGDLTGLPPLLLTATRGEVLFSDTERFAEKARASGVDTNLHVVEDSVHVFPIFPFLPESQELLEHFSAWARRLAKLSKVGA